MTRARMAYVAGLLLAVAAGVVLYTRDPSATGNYPPCPFFYATGLHCPGCGTMRGLHSLLHGDLLSAIGFNVLMVVALPFLLVEGVQLTRRVWGKAHHAPNAHPAWLWVLLGGIVVYWVLRNLPLWPFSLLAPSM